MVLTAPISNGTTVIGALGVTLYLDDFSAMLEDLLRLPTGLEVYAAQTSTGLICMHADPSLLLEPGASAGISPVAGGVQISDSLGWTSILGAPAE